MCETSVPELEIGSPLSQVQQRDLDVACGRATARRMPQFSIDEETRLFGLVRDGEMEPAFVRNSGRMGLEVAIVIASQHDGGVGGGKGGFPWDKPESPAWHVFLRFVEGENPCQIGWVSKPNPGLAREYWGQAERLFVADFNKAGAFQRHRLGAPGEWPRRACDDSAQCTAVKSVAGQVVELQGKCIFVQRPIEERMIGQHGGDIGLLGRVVGCFRIQNKRVRIARNEFDGLPLPGRLVTS